MHKLISYTWYVKIDSRTGIPYGYFKVDNYTGKTISEFGHFVFDSQLKFRRDEPITDSIIARQLDEEYNEFNRQTEELESQLTDEERW